MKKIRYLLLIVLAYSCSKKDDPGLNNNNNNTPAPAAEFIFSGDNVPAPAEVAFTNQSTNAASYSWNFGDGNNSTQANPSHIYVSGGTYNVTLTATGTGGTNSKTKSVTLLAGPTTAVLDDLIVLDTLPYLKPGGGSWDPTDGPDVYIKITRNSVVLYSTETTGLYPNVNMGAQPAWVVFPSVFITPLTNNAVIEVWDDDGATDELMATATFIPANHPGQPSTVTISNGDLRVTFSVMWQ